LIWIYKSKSNLRILGCYKRSDDDIVNLTRVKRALYPENISLRLSLVQDCKNCKLLTTRLVLCLPKPLAKHMSNGQIK
jgi:hypothetical protein